MTALFAQLVFAEEAKRSHDLERLQDKTAECLWFLLEKINADTPEIYESMSFSDMDFDRQDLLNEIGKKFPKMPGIDSIDSYILFKGTVGDAAKILAKWELKAEEKNRSHLR